MGLSTPPPQIAVARQNAATPSKSLGWGSCMVGGKLYACTTCSGTEENFLLIWNDPRNPAAFTAVDLGVTAKRTSSVCVDTVNNCAYIGIFKPSSSSMTIYKVALDTLAATTLVNAVALGATPSSWQLVPSGAIATDGTSIFATANSVGSASWVFSFSCVDGSFVARHQWSAVAASTFEATAVAVYDSGNVVFGGSFGWLGKMDKALTTEVAGPVWTNGVSSVLQNQQGVLVIGGNIWSSGTDAAATSLFLYKWDGALSAGTSFPLGLTFFNDTSWNPAPISYDGTYIWAIHNTTGQVVKFDPVGGTVVGRWNELSALLPAGESFTGVYGIQENQYVAICGEAFDGISRVIVGSEGYPAVYPIPVLGRGAGR